MMNCVRMLVGIWVPPQDIRELRGLVTQRKKMTGLVTQAKNRLHAVLQRHHLLPPEGNPFHESQQEWWLALAVGKLERLNIPSDLETLRFAQRQQALTSLMEEIANQNEQIIHLLQLPGFGS